MCVLRVCWLDCFCLSTGINVKEGDETFMYRVNKGKKRQVTMSTWLIYIFTSTHSHTHHVLRSVFQNRFQAHVWVCVMCVEAGQQVNMANLYIHTHTLTYTPCHNKCFPIVIQVHVLSEIKPSTYLYEIQKHGIPVTDLS